MIQGSIDQCLMSFTKSVKQHRLGNTKRKQKYLMNESNLCPVVTKKRFKSTQKNSINLIISDKIADHDQIDGKYKLKHKSDQRKSKVSKSKFLKNISTSTLIRGKTLTDTWPESKKYSILKPGVFKSNLKALMNSTEMDVRKNLRSSKILHNSSCSGYASSGSSDIEFPICTKGQSNDCCCEKCWENVFKNESWNESNFLSSTPMVEEPQIAEQNMMRKFSVKADELKNFQNYLNPKRVEMNAISKKSKNLKRIIKMKENIRAKASKINPGNVLISNDERNFESYTSMVPISSDENFTKFGDFVVWYV